MENDVGISVCYYIVPQCGQAISLLDKGYIFIGGTALQQNDNPTTTHRQDRVVSHVAVDRHERASTTRRLVQH